MRKPKPLERSHQSCAHFLKTSLNMLGRAGVHSSQGRGEGVPHAVRAPDAQGPRAGWSRSSHAPCSSARASPSKQESRRRRLLGAAPGVTPPSPARPWPGQHSSQGPRTTVGRREVTKSLVGFHPRRPQTAIKRSGLRGGVGSKGGGGRRP